MGVLEKRKKEGIKYDRGKDKDKDRDRGQRRVVYGEYELMEK